MFDVTYREGEMAVESDVPLIPVIESFLVTLGFSGDGERRMTIKPSSPYDTIESVNKMLSVYADVGFDANCQQIIDAMKEAVQDFQKVVGRAVEIKRKDKEHWGQTGITVPKMCPDVSLKWYQKMPIVHAMTLGNSANFSVPGSGKTWMGYSTFLKLKYEEKTIDKLLIVAPLAAFRPWETEYEVMTGDGSKGILRLVGGRSKRNKLFRYSISDYDKFLISHSMAGKEEENLIRMMQNSRFMVIVDESHNIKRHDGQRAMALRNIAPHAERRMILSGTPVPNNLEDLWSQFTFLYPDNSILGKWTKYEQDCKDADAVKTISSRLDPYFVRVSKDMLNLPKPTFNPKNPGHRPTVVPMNPIQRRIYDTIALRVRENADQFREDAVALEKFRKNAMMYLIEAATDPSLLTKDTTYQSEEIEPEGLDILELLSKYPKLRHERPNKIETAIQMAMETLGDGKKVIIWCSFINTIKKMSERMESEGHKSVNIWGGVPRDEEIDPNYNREGEIEKFKTDDRRNVLIANPASLAESVSLHRVCHHSIYVDRTFNGAHYMQSLERIHRVGLGHDVNTRYDILQSEHSIDQTIHERLMMKQKNMESFLRSDAIEIQDIDDSTDSGFDGGYEADFDAVIRDMKRNVGNA